MKSGDLHQYLVSLPGRCNTCGWDPPTQGHHPKCGTNNKKATRKR